MMSRLLLGGWRDVVERVRKLEDGLRALPDRCTCGHTDAHLASACDCCARGERALDNGCTNCVELLEPLRARTDVLFDATLRFLPPLESAAASEPRPETSDAIRQTRRYIERVDTLLLGIETGAAEYRRGCGASHLGPLRSLTAELGAAVRDADAALMALLRLAPVR